MALKSFDKKSFKFPMMFKKIIRTAGFVCLLGAIANACVEKSDTDEDLTARAIANTVYPSAQGSLLLWPKREISPSRDAQIEQKVSAILSSMSLEEKVGQIIQPEIANVTPEDVRIYHLGSVLNGGGTRPNNDKYASVDDWVNLAAQFHEASMDSSDGYAAIPLIWGSDAIHGNNNLYGATLFPHNIGLGAARDSQMIARIGRATALELAATGVTWTFGPTVAVARDVRWGRTYESYSEDPKVVADYARAMVTGIQGDARTPGEYNPATVVATAKHFLGDGGTTQGVDRGDTMVTEQELIDVHAPGYVAALDSNVSTTMASFNSWNGDRLHGHKYLITDVLKGRMGFDGLVVSDWNGHRHVIGCSVERCAAAINAGIDILMVPSDWKAMLENTIKDVRQGNISLARLDDAVTRVLRVKMRAGLFDAGPVKERLIVGDKTLIGHADHRALAREAVRKSLVLLKNNNQLLPLSPTANILVAGDAADDIGKQSGGWTLSWQGTGNTNNDFPGASSIFDGIESVVASAGGKIHLHEDGLWDETSFENSAKPDVAIVVYGEDPYAEWHGDLANIEYQYGSKEDLKLLNRLKSQDIPVVSVFISGRPLWVNKELNASDAFVAAWLPGSEGAGLADVLFSEHKNKPVYDFTGRLSFSWPNAISHAKLNKDAADYKPLFEYGYGLSYRTDVKVPDAVKNNTLDESTALPANAELEEYWFFVSREMSAWTFYSQAEGEARKQVSNRPRDASREHLLFDLADKLAQQDARRVRWSGGKRVIFSMATDYAQDFSAYLANGGALSFDLKVDTIPNKAVSLSLACEGECSKSVDISQHLKTSNLGEYSNYKVALDCFTNSDSSKLDKLNSVFRIDTKGYLDISVANIKVLPNVAPEKLLKCAVPELAVK